MKTPIEHLRIIHELRLFVPFIKAYFGKRVRKIILFGSFLHFFRFRQLSDIDLAILLKDGDGWSLSQSEKCWDPNDGTPVREIFFETFRKFRMKHSFRRIYDIKLYTEKDLRLLREFQKDHPPPRGGCLIDDILAGKILLDAQQNSLSISKSEN